MSRQSRENPEIRKFILDNIANHSGDIGPLTAKTFKISRVASSGYLRRLTQAGILVAEGNTQKRRYHLKEMVKDVFKLGLSKALEEDVVWQYKILPHFTDIKKNIVDICQYGFTEMLNNAIDHSISEDAILSYDRTYNSITLRVIDHGVGIFEKIQRDFKLSDPRTALLELSKGGLTSDPKNHAGEGIFYTSRMFDSFTVKSGFLFYVRERKEGDEWLIETRDLIDYQKGTAITMRISTEAEWTTKDVFTQFEGDRPRFRKTHVPISLSQYAGEALVSRSQAKRVLARFERFSEVLLDFNNVEFIGQGFADEIFRVYKNAHPDIAIIAVNTTNTVSRMIEFVQSTDSK